jgi:peptidoglycan/LPS O-acetylase OafA/YrhL
LAVAGCAGLIVSLVFRNPAFRETFRYSLQGIALYPMFYYCIATKYSWIIRILEQRVLRWFGALSYSIYLSHLYILTELRGRYPHSQIVAGLVSLGLCVAFAWMMRIVVELPLQRFRTSFRS